MFDAHSNVDCVWRPLSWLGLTGKFFSMGSHEITIVVHTWAVLIVLLLLCCVARWILKNKQGLARYVVLYGVNTFVDMCKQTMGTFHFSHFCFVVTVFVFIFLCNIISVIPYLEEPTQNLNTTLALSLVSFVYVQASGIRAHGFLGYLKEYIDPFFLMAPLHVISKFASTVSMAFRLFGNIFGGAMITGMYFKLIRSHVVLELFGLLGLNLVIVGFFGLFEGFLQAFVFTMLSLTYLSIATQKESHDEKVAT